LFSEKGLSLEEGYKNINRTFNPPTIFQENLEFPDNSNGTNDLKQYLTEKASSGVKEEVTTAPTVTHNPRLASVAL
jgi:hypothetical protein